jgi:uncharacterized YccA/Bax inhibitor family protein
MSDGQDCAADRRQRPGGIVSNPIFNSNPAFSTRGPVVQRAQPQSGPPGPDGQLRQYGQGQYGQGQYGQGQYGQYGAAGAAGADAGALEQLYSAPSATTRDTSRMTYDDVIVKTAGLLAVLVTAAAITWFVAPQLFWVGMIVGLILGLVNAFKREPSPVLIFAYAIAEGVFLGGISYILQETLGARPGADLAVQPIVLQALLATGATFLAALFLFRSGRVRVTAKSVRWLLVAMVGYGVFSLVNLGLMWFGGMDGWGLRSEVSVLGIPLGVIIGIAAVGMAAFSLIVDFDSIKRGVERGVPARYAWSAAFGLVVTLVWLYLEFLRILAILRGNN